MSLHAQPSEEVLRALDNQKRKSTVSSIVIALLSLTLLALTLAFILLPKPEEFVEFTHYPSPTNTDCPPIDKPTIKTKTKPTALPAAATKYLLADTPTDLAMPAVQNATEGERIGAGDFGDDGWNGNGDGEGDSIFKPITNGFKNRCSQKERLALIAEAGGDAKLDDHVVNALRFLKTTQAADGGWGAQHRSAMTALALLSYLGHCETPESEEFGESCLKAIVFLIDHAKKNDGRLSSAGNDHQTPYEEAIATYAIAEAYGMCENMQIPELRETVQKAGQFLIDQQHSSGGWDYGYQESSARGGDLSITGWHVQALHACAATKLDFKNLKPCVRKALDYVESLQDESGGFGYSSTNAAGSAGWHTLTGTGMLCLQMNGNANSTPVRKGARYALKSAPFSYESADCDLYAHYYLALAMFQRGGKEWQTYQARIIPALMQHQKADGSWPRPGGGQAVRSPGALFAQESTTALHYRTCLATLTMEVYYRYLKTH
jgi:hypothetical protein